MKKWSTLLALLIALAVVSAVLYLVSADQFGFPLDDAWIHQTYARNLGLHGMMAFSPRALHGQHLRRLDRYPCCGLFFKHSISILGISMGMHFCCCRCIYHRTT